MFFNLRSNRVCCRFRIDGLVSKEWGRLRFLPVAIAAAAATPIGPERERLFEYLVYIVPKEVIQHKTADSLLWSIVFYLRHPFQNRIGLCKSELHVFHSSFKIYFFVFFLRILSL